MAAGGWYTPLCDENGKDIKFTQVKCYKLVFDDAKYLCPPNEPSAPIIPSIKDRESLEFICNSLNLKYSGLLIERLGKLLDVNNFSNYVQIINCVKGFLPIYITEGSKKVFSLISQGYLAIGVPDILMFFTINIDNSHKPTLTDSNVKILNPTLKAILTGACDVKIAYDQDEKESTRVKVFCAANAFKKSMVKSAQVDSSKVSILQWDNKLGKGIDDYFANGHLLDLVTEIKSSVVKWYRDLTALTNQEVVTNV